MQGETAAAASCESGFAPCLAISRVVVSLEGRNFRDTVGVPNKDEACSWRLLAGHLRPGTDKKLPALRTQDLSLVCLWSRAWHTAQTPGVFAGRPKALAAPQRIWLDLLLAWVAKNQSGSQELW